MADVADGSAHAVRPRLDGVKAIGDYIGKPERWVYQARERGWSLPFSWQAS